MPDIDPRSDPGLRRVLTWVLIALIATLVLTYVAVNLAIHWFDPAA